MSKYYFEAVISGSNIDERTIVYNSVVKASNDFGVSQKMIIRALNYINLSGHNANRIISNSDEFYGCNVELIGINIPVPPNHLFTREPRLTTNRQISSYYLKNKNASRNRSEIVYEVEDLNRVEKICGTTNLLRYLIDQNPSSLGYLRNNDVAFDVADTALRSFLKNKKFSELQDFRKGKFGHHYVTTL